MKNILLISLVALLFACTKEDGTIQGAVTRNKVLQAGSTVKLYTESVDIYGTQKTNAKGEYKFTKLPEGNYYIGATITVNDSVFDTGTSSLLIYVSKTGSKTQPLDLSYRKN